MTAFEKLQDLHNNPAKMEQRRKDLIKGCSDEVRSYNEPNKYVVAINCAHIGDDNDYSCVLSNVCVTLFEAGKKDLAYRMYLTDPMRERNGENDNRDKFTEYMNYCIDFKNK